MSDINLKTTVQHKTPRSTNLILVVMAIALVGLVGVNAFLYFKLSDTQDDLADARAAGTSQRNEQSRKIDAQTAQLVTLTSKVSRLMSDNAAKDRQISGLQAQNAGLVTLLRRNGITIPMSLERQVQQATRSTLTTNAPSPSTPSPLPSSSPTPSVSPTVTSAPSVSPSGLLPATTSLLCVVVPGLC